MPRSDAPIPERTRDRRSVVLVIDDEKGPRESLRMILSSEYRVLIADDGQSALDILRSRPVDLVTTDLNMAGIKGDQLARIIREKYPEIEIIVISGFATVEAAVASIRRGVCDFLTKPFDVVQVKAAVTRALQRQQGRRWLVSFLEGIGHTVARDRTTDDILREFQSNQSLQKRLRSLVEGPRATPPVEREEEIDPQQLEFLELLVDTIESHDPETRGHARRVSFYAGLIADRMKLSDTLREHTRIAAFLHDLGKLGLPHDLTPVGQFRCPVPRSAAKEHPAISERLLRSLGFPMTITDALRHHHERWDGKGYPDGLRGDETPLLARIIAVADAFDAMVRDRGDAPNRRRRAALRELQIGAGSQFDARAVGVLCEISRIPARDEPPYPAASSAELHLTFPEYRREALAQ